METYKGSITTMKQPYQVKPYLNLPDDYDAVKAEEYNNGCGPGNWKGKFVPETNYGIRISDACHVHDFDFGKKQERGYLKLVDYFHPIVRAYMAEEHDILKGGYPPFSPFEIYNYRFWSNILEIIDRESKWWNRFLNPLRRRRAKTYYWFVHKTGSMYFKK